jgi:hypothetical protein
MVEKVLQLHREKTIFWALVGVLFLCAGFYMYFVSATIRNVVARQSIENDASQLTLSISNKEFQYITKRSQVTLPLAYSLGFKDVVAKTFVSRNSLSKVSFLENH